MLQNLLMERDIYTTVEQHERGFAAGRNVWLGTAAISAAVASETQDTATWLLSGAALLGAAAFEGIRRMMARASRREN